MLIADNENRILVTPQRLVAESRLEFRRAALEHLERVVRGGATRMIVDMQHTTEIDASGLGVLVLLQKRGRDLMIATKLLHPPIAVKQMLELTKLDYLFEIEG
jgi:anti-anti-sigma regulatory factor